MRSTDEIRQTRKSMIRDMIETHRKRADELERHARHWWRASKYAWLHAAFIHRDAARQLSTILEGIERGVWDT